MNDRKEERMDWYKTASLDRRRHKNI